MEAQENSTGFNLTQQETNNKMVKSIAVLESLIEIIANRIGISKEEYDKIFYEMIEEVNKDNNLIINIKEK